MQRPPHHVHIPASVSTTSTPSGSANSHNNLWSCDGYVSVSHNNPSLRLLKQSFVIDSKKKNEYASMSLLQPLHYCSQFLNIIQTAVVLFCSFLCWIGIFNKGSLLRNLLRCHHTCSMDSDDDNDFPRDMGVSS